MDTETIISASLLVKVALGAIVGYIMYKVRKSEARSEKSISRNEARELIADKLKPIEVMQRELKEDTKEIAQKLDKLLDHVLAQKH